MSDGQKAIVVAHLPKNSSQRIAVVLDTFKGTPVLRVWIEFQARDGAWRATTNGLCVALFHLPALADGLQRALKVAIEAGRLPGG